MWLQFATVQLFQIIHCFQQIQTGCLVQACSGHRCSIRTGVLKAMYDLEQKATWCQFSLGSLKVQVLYGSRESKVAEKAKSKANHATAYCYERAKLCVPSVVASSVRDMDVESEWCVKKAVITLFLKEQIKKRYGATFFSILKI